MTVAQVPLIAKNVTQNRKIIQYPFHLPESNPHLSFLPYLYFSFPSPNSIHFFPNLSLLWSLCISSSPLLSILRRPPKSLALPTPENSGSTLSAPPQTSVQLHGGSPPAAPAQSLPTYCEEQLRPPVHKSQVQVTRRAQRIRALPRSSPWEPESSSPRSYVLKVR